MQALHIPRCLPGLQHDNQAFARQDPGSSGFFASEVRSRQLGLQGEEDVCLAASTDSSLTRRTSQSFRTSTCSQKSLLQTVIWKAEKQSRAFCFCQVHRFALSGPRANRHLAPENRIYMFQKNGVLAASSLWPFPPPAEKFMWI